MRWTPGGEGSSTLRRSENSEISMFSLAPAITTKIILLLLSFQFILCESGVWDVKNENSSEEVAAELNVTYSRVVGQEGTSVHYVYKFNAKRPRLLRLSARGNSTEVISRTAYKIQRAKMPVSRSFCLESHEDVLVVTLENATNYRLTLEEVIDVDYSVGQGGEAKDLTAGDVDLRLLDFSGSPSYVRVTVRSENTDTCGIVSVVPIGKSENDDWCPGATSSEQVKGTVYQTMLGFASFMIDTTDQVYSAGGAFLAFKLTNDDEPCISKLEMSHHDHVRNKTFRFDLSDVDLKGGFFFEIGLVTAFFFLLSVIALVVTCSHAARVDRASDAQEGIKVIQESSDSIFTSSTSASVATFASGSTSVYSDDASSSDQVKKGQRNYVESSRDLEESLQIAEATSAKRQNSGRGRPKYLSDLNLMDHHTSAARNYFYAWSVITVGLFYGVPAFQVVMAHQRELSASGNQDICYYNHLCAIPISSSLRDFNHIFSNIWYMGLGALLAWLIRYRHVTRCRLLREVELQMGRDARDKLSQMGVPQRHGVFYAIAAALAMQGVLSMCYHICPTESNFQFDTTFMHIIAALCFLKVYQFRHADEDSAGIFMGMGAVVCIEVVGIASGGGTAFWCFALVAYFVLSVLFTAVIIYCPETDSVAASLTSLVLSFLSVFRLTSRPDHFSGRRLALACSMNALNLCFLISGAVTRPGISIYLLTILICNLGAYVIYYALMKLTHRERLSGVTMAYIALGISVWLTAAVFYAGVDYAIEMTPAESRDLNSECLVLDVFDAHDVWHVLSASGLFCAFMVLLTFDDGVAFVPRSQLRVF